MKNGVFTALRFGMHALSGFVFIPFFLQQFGNGTYGLIALAGFLTQFIGLISNSVGMAVGRFMNVALNKNDWQQANEIYSTAIAANLVFICIQLPLFALGLWKLEWILDFAPEIASEFRFLVICNIAVFFVGMIGGVIFTPIQAANRLDIGLKMDIARQTLRLILLFSLILGVGAKLWIIGVVDLGLSLIFFLITLGICRKMVDSKLAFKLKSITWKWAKPVLGMAIWVLVFTLGQSFFVKTDVWVANKFGSKEMAGVYAALLVWPNFIRQIGNQVASLIAPVYMIDFAKNNTGRIAEGCMFLSRTMSFFAAVVGGAICGCGSLVLSLWLGEEYAVYNNLLFVMIIYVVLTLSKAATWPVFTAFNKVNQLGVTTLVCGVLNLVLSIGLVLLGHGAMGVAIATLASLFLLYGILYPWRVSTILKIPLMPFMNCHLLTLGLFLFITYALSYIFTLSIGIYLQGAAVLLILALAVLLIWGVFLHSQERTRILNLVGQVGGKLSGIFSR